MIAYRRERANGFIQEELTLLIENEVHDPRVRLLTVTDVDLTPDRRIARIYVACYGTDEDLAQGLRGLQSAKGFLRSKLSQLLHWNFAPELEFRVDRSWEQGAKIDRLLQEIQREREDQPAGDPPSSEATQS